MTNNPQLVKQAKKDLKLIHEVSPGVYTMERQLEELKKRLFNLEEAILWYDGAERERIATAIDAHREKQRELEKKIKIEYDKLND